MAVSSEQVYRGLSTSRKWLERALVVLAEHQAFVGMMADELAAIAGKVQEGVEISYQEMMTARAELRRYSYVEKLVKIAGSRQQKAESPKAQAEKAREERRIRREKRSGRLPYFNDATALRQMWLYLDSFPSGSAERDMLQFTQCLRPGRAGLPCADLRAKVIETALAAGWKYGVEHWLAAGDLEGAK